MSLVVSSFIAAWNSIEAAAYWPVPLSSRPRQMWPLAPALPLLAIACEHAVRGLLDPLAILGVLVLAPIGLA